MHSYLAQLLGEYIVVQRSNKGISQKELAKKLKISAQFLGRIEKGDAQMPEPTLLLCIFKLKLKQNKMIKIYEKAGHLKAKDLFSKQKIS